MRAVGCTAENVIPGLGVIHPNLTTQSVFNINSLSDDCGFFEVKYFLKCIILYMHHELCMQHDYAYCLLFF